MAINGVYGVFNRFYVSILKTQVKRALNCFKIFVQKMLEY